MLGQGYCSFSLTPSAHLPVCMYLSFHPNLSLVTLAQIWFFQAVMLEQLCILDDRNLRLDFNQSFVVSGVNVTSDILLMLDF